MSFSVIEGDVTLKDQNGTALDAADSTAIPAGTHGILVLGSDGTNARFVKISSDGTVKVDPSGTTTQPVSAVSLPLPTGAATSAKQPALGAAGTASADVITVQGIASMTALKIDGSAVTQPVSGTITANQGNAAVLSGAWTVKVTDGTNSMPTGDVASRAIFHKATDGTNVAAVAAASTAAVAADPALVVSLSPNTPIATTVAASDAALSTNILSVGGNGKDTKPTAVTGGNTVRAWYSTVGRAHTESDPGYDFAAVTTSDSTDLSTKPTRALYVGTGGDIVVDSVATTSITFKNVPPGTMLPLAVYRVRATGTTASNIVAIY